MSNNGDVLNSSTKTGTTIDELSLGPTHKQTVTLSGREAAYTIHGFEVDIHSSIDSTEGPIDAGSSKVKISTITNQNWELQSHGGTIVASNRQYLVYVLEGRNGHVLRLIQQETNNRALLKGFVGAILDVSFAHANSNLLACVDQGGNVYIWDLDRTQDVSKIQFDALKVEIDRSTVVDSLQHRLVWSPYVPQEEEDDEPDSCCMVVTHGSDVEVFDVHVVFRNVITGMRMARDKLREGILVIANAHEKTISDISLSPDGAVLATASEDGHLKFWQVNWELQSDEKPKCLHDFEPHKGAPVSRLIFCDNHLSQDPNAEFWRFLITAANHNTEVKIWCAVTWKCLQTLHFCPPHDNLDKLQPHILLRLDLSASYLLATDAKRMALYILQFFQDTSLGDASVTSITEYILTQPILSFVVSGHTPLSQSDVDSGDEGEEVASPSGVKDFDSRRNVALIKLHCIQSRSMQELLVKFEPPDIFGIPGVGEDLHQVSKGSLSEPVSTHLSYDSPLAHDSSLGFTPSLPLPLHLPPSTTSQFSSLPTDVLTMNNTYHIEDITPPAATTTLFHSLTSTSNTVGSPKLFTPSEFASPAKVKSDPLTTSSEQTLFNMLQDKTTHPSPDHQEQQTSSPGTASFSSSQLPALIQSTSKSEQSPSPIQSSVTPPTLTSVSDFGAEMRSESASISQRDDATGIELNTHIVANGLKSTLEPQATNSDAETGGLPNDDTIEDAESLEDVPLNTEALDKQTADIQTLDLGPDSEAEQPEPREEHSVMIDSGDKKDEASGMSEFNASGSEEGGRDVQQNFDSIFELLKVDKPPTSVPEPSPMSYEQFTDLLTDRSKLQEHEYALSSTEKSTTVTESSELVSLPVHSQDNGNLSESKDDNSEIVNAAGNSAPADYLELLRQRVPSSNNENTPLISDLGISNHNSKKRKPSESDEWPDIGAPEMVIAFERSGKPDTTVSIGTQQQQQLQQNSTDVDINTLTPSLSEDTQLVMPSADVPPMDSGMLHVGDVNLPTLEPAIEIAEKEAPNEEEEEEEVEEGVQVSQGSAAKVVQTPDSGTKPRKRSKRGGKSKSKKQLASSVGAFPLVGVTDVLEEGPSDGEPVLLASNAVEGTLVRSSGTDNTALISQLYQLVCSQQQEIYQLREEQRNNFVALQHQLQGMEATLTETPKSILNEYSKEQQQRFDKMMRDKQLMDKQRQDRLISSLSQTLTTAVNTKLEKLVKNEIKNSVIPTFNRSLGSIQQQLAEVVSHRLNAMDAAVKEGIAHVLQSRGLPEQIGGTVAASLQRTLVGNYEEVFKVTVLPSFQKSCQEMFRQIDEAFRKGTAEYVSQFQQHHHQFQDQSLQHVTASVHSLLAGSQGSPLYSNIQACLNHEVTTLMQHTQQVIVEAVSTAVQKEVAAAIEQQASKLNPAQVQQEEKKKKEEEILRFLQFQNYNSAFEVALSTSDLQLVVFVCQQLNPDEIFDQTACPLSQPVLLSLIQQLSVDLQDHLDLKIKYLEQSILALDMSSEITKSHVISVVTHLTRSLITIERGFQTNPASNSVMKNVKKLRILAEHTCRPST